MSAVHVRRTSTISVAITAPPGSLVPQRGGRGPRPGWPSRRGTRGTWLAALRATESEGGRNDGGVQPRDRAAGTVAVADLSADGAARDPGPVHGDGLHVVERAERESERLRH